MCAPTRISKNIFNKHRVKSVRTRSYSGPYFPAFGLNKERYSLTLCIQSECRIMRTRITPNTSIFHAVKYASAKIVECMFINSTY